jgi:hypothetical protein
MQSLTTVALYDPFARKVLQTVRILGYDKTLLYVEWPDHVRTWSPRYIFDHGYELCVY